MHNKPRRPNFLKAVIISLRGGIAFGKRFSVLAKEMADSENNLQRRKELKEISAICNWVPENPPRNFQEALQFIWFITLVSRVYELNMNGYAIRLDQLLYPIYKKDEEKGKIKREDAQELWNRILYEVDDTRKEYNLQGIIRSPNRDKMPRAGPESGD